MDDLSSTIGSILSDPQKMEQLRAVAQSLGINPDASPPENGSQGGGFDPSAIASMFQSLQNLNGGSHSSNQAGSGSGDTGASQNAANEGTDRGTNFVNDSGNPDNGGNTNPGTNTNNGANMNFNGGNSGGNFGGNGGFNFGSFAKIAEVMGTFNQSDKNVDLLRSLKPHFSPTRAGRIDDAVRLMQLMRAWPALRDSGLLGSLGNLFAGGGQR